MTVAAMMRMVRPELRPSQNEALTAFATWLWERHGAKSLDIWRFSAILRMVNNGDMQRVATELLNWVYTDDKIDEALVKRRIRERMMWEVRT